MRLIEGLALFTAAICLVIAIGAIEQAKNAADAADKAKEATVLNHQAIEDNRLTLCAAARIVSFNPVNQLPGETDGRFRKRIGAYETFLRLAGLIDCKTVLAQFIRQLTDGTALEGVGDSSGNSPSSQPSPGRPGPRGPRGPQGNPAPAPPTPSPGNSSICSPGVLPNLPAVCVQ